MLYCTTGTQRTLNCSLAAGTSPSSQGRPLLNADHIQPSPKVLIIDSLCQDNISRVVPRYRAVAVVQQRCGMWYSNEAVGEASGLIRPGIAATGGWLLDIDIDSVNTDIDITDYTIGL
ncbi:hypothetical protein J6590_071113 [Homalodisca vitripennis]|nr:hypothetical protein J6590_071113 [Homalodisca vitripennis]